MNFFWEKREAIGVSLGLKRESLRSLGQLWQFLPRVKIGDKVFKGQAIATVQTTSQLKSLVTPVAGRVALIDYNAVERPETIDDKLSLFHIEGEENEMFGV